MSIINWLNTPNHNYNEGVALFEKYSRDKALIRYFKTGTAQFRMKKLEYEMRKIANNAKIVETKRASFLQRATPSPKIPDIILAAKREISALYSQIDKMHTQLYDCGTSNVEKIVKKRKRILDKRKPVIERAEKLYLLKEEWFALNDSQPRTNIEQQIREMLTDAAIDDGKLKIENDSAIAEMSDMELAKRRTQLRSSITKTQNMLQYQSIRKSETATPMPNGPKRTEYELKLTTLKTEYTQICSEIELRTNN